MYPLFFLFLVVSILKSSLGLACTTVFLSSDVKKILGKSYDWNQSHGAVTVNKRSVSKTAFSIKASENPVSWTSKFGSVTFNQHGREFPLSGLNENGLAVEIMWLNEAQYPKQDERQSINELQWIQYQLDNFSSVSEAVLAVEKIRISNIYANVHYLMCDRLGDCATVEFLDHKTVVHTGDLLPYKVLTNNSYFSSLDFLKKHVGFGGVLPIPTSMNSLDRFVRAVSLGQKVSTDFSGVYEILSSVKQGSYSVWNVAYDLTEAEISFRTNSKTSSREFNTRGFDYSCKSPVLTLDMDENLSGDITNRFVFYSAEKNASMIEKSLEGNPLAGLIKNKMMRYPETTVCQER